MPQSITWRRGAELPLQLQREALRTFLHRYTGDHVPAWVRREAARGIVYPKQFRDDAEWLAHTTFAVTKAGQLHREIGYCLSRPTFPDGTKIINCAAN